MKLNTGGVTSIVVCLSLVTVLGINEAYQWFKGPDVAAGTVDASDEDPAWITVRNSILRSDTSLTDVSQDPQTQALTLVYTPSVDNSEAQSWSYHMMSVIGHALAALNNTPEGKQYQKVTVKAQLATCAECSPVQYTDGATLTYDMSGFEAIKTERDGYANFASAPQALELSERGHKVATEGCQGSQAAFYPSFCERVMKQAE